MVETNTATFNADWASPPGDLIEEALEECGWSRAELAQRLGFSAKHVNELLKGRAPITADTAQRLERVLGHEAGFWLRLEVNYQRDLVRLRQLGELADQKGWLKELPLRWMQRQGWVETCSHPGQQVSACLKFFAVASVEAWRERYGQPLAVYRTSRSHATQQGALASWLRRSETMAATLPCGVYQARAFKAALQQMRSLSLEPEPEVFVPMVQGLAAAAGVAVVFVPAPPGCRVSGATCWLSPDRALIALSLRHKTNDHLWFTLFHEAGHLLLHGKKATFVDGLDGQDAEHEAEANRFAANQLIPPTAACQLRGLRSEVEVRAAAQTLGIAPGIVVGRLQHEGWLPRTHLNGLKVSYQWPELKALVDGLNDCGVGRPGA
jgi:HTH-type transcriptional regulator/antitoxin HigA